MNTRRKGQSTLAKAIRYARSFPGTRTITMYQASRFATPQPFDLLLFRPTYWPCLVEVRTSQWRTGRASTVELAQLPGEGYHKLIFRFNPRQTVPDIRRWDQHTQIWVTQDHPWEEA